MRPVDLTDQRFYRLTAVKRFGLKWLWRCDCGVEKLIYTDKVKSGHTRSCGCLLKEVIAEKTKHGHGYGHGQKKRDSRTYRAWINMRWRANAGPGEQYYEDYKGRGIAICEKWNTSFVEFLKDMGECPPSLTLDRIDNDGDYIPENCRWATRQQQNKNTRKTIRVMLDGKEFCMKDACEKLNVVYPSVLLRVKKGMSPQQALELPFKPGKQRTFWERRD